MNRERRVVLAVPAVNVTRPTFLFATQQPRCRYERDKAVGLSGHYVGNACLAQAASPPRCTLSCELCTRVAVLCRRSGGGGSCQYILVERLLCDNGSELGGLVSGWARLKLLKQENSSKVLLIERRVPFI